MRTTVVTLLALTLLLVLSGCGMSGETVNVRQPLPGKAPDLLLGIPSSIQAGQTLSAEFLGTDGSGTPPTDLPSDD